MTSAELQYLLAQVADLDGDPNEALARLEATATRADAPVLREAIEVDHGNYLAELVGPLVGELEGVSALPFLLRALRRGEEQNRDHDGLRFGITELVTSNVADAIPVLAEMARSPTAGHRRDAAWLWGYVAEAALLGPLLELSRDPDPHVASHAIGSLSSYKGREEVFARLTEALSEDDEDLRVSAAGALGYYDDARAIPLLKPFANDDSADVRRVARHALRQLGAS